MKGSSIRFLVVSIILMILQVCVFSHIYLFGYAMAFVFLYILAAIPFSVSLNAIYTIGFGCGFIIDIFTDTLGVNTISATLLAALRHPIFKLYSSKTEDIGSLYISSKTVGMAVFTKYIFTLSLIYCIIAFVIESMAFFNILRLTFNVIGSTIFTFIIILAINSLNTQNEKRL